MHFDNGGNNDNGAVDFTAGISVQDAEHELVKIIDHRSQYMRQMQDTEEGQQTTKKKHEWIERVCEWLKADKERQKLSERKLRKLEKKKRKRQQKRRKRINARIDRGVSLLAVALCVAASFTDVLRRQGKLPSGKSKSD